MKILRAVTRRGFNVGTAGFFSGVLRSNTWSAASRLPDGARFFVHQSTWTASPPALGQGVPRSTGNEQTIPPSLIATSPKGNRQSLQRVLVVLAALVITAVLLCWIIQPR